MFIDETLLRGLDSTKLHKDKEVNYQAYTILWVVLGFGLVVLALLGYALWMDCRKRNKADKEENYRHTHVKSAKLMHDPNREGEKQSFHHATRNLYPNPEIEEKGSLFDGSMVTTTTTEIQPKAPPLSCEKIDEMSRQSGSFGMVNIHQQSSQASSTTFSTHPPSTSITNASSSISLAGKRMSRLESFPFEEYGIPESERQPIKTRVQDLKTYDHYLHLTQVDSVDLREESNSDEQNSSGNEDEPRSGRFENQPTLPRDFQDRS